MEETKRYRVYSEEDEGAASSIDKWEMAKQVACMAASGCATVVAHKVLKANLPDADSMFEKAVIGVGTYFVTGLVGSKVAEHCDKELEQFRSSLKAGKELTDGRDD